jgi:MFS family permease
MTARVDPISPPATTTNGHAPPASHAAPAGRAVTALPDRRFVTAALMIVMVLASMEQTISSTAMPTIIGDLHGLAHFSWVASIYLLASTVTMPLYGRLADAFGRKRVILAAIGLFTAGSLLAGTAQSLWQLILWRAMQGLGAGGVMPLVLTILGDVFTIQERARIQGLFSAVWGTASLAGPALGALLVQTLGWRSIFYVNLPFAFLAMVMLVRKYRDAEQPHKTPMDLGGATLLIAGCAALLAVVSLMGSGTVENSTLVLFGGFAALALAWFVWHVRRTPHPILPLPLLLTDRAIAPSLAGSMLMGISIFAIDTYVPLYVQGGRGGGVNQAASVVTPVMLTWALSSLLAAPLIVRWGFRRVALLGSCISVAGMSGLLICAFREAPPWTTTAVLAMTGCGFGPASMAYLLAAQDAVNFQRRGIVTSSVGFCRSFGGAVGIGLLGAMFNLLAGPRLAQLRGQGVKADALLNPASLTGVSPATLHLARQAIGSSLTRVFAAMLAGAFVQLLITLLMRDRRPKHAISRAEGFEAATA